MFENPFGDPFGREPEETATVRKEWLVALTMFSLDAYRALVVLSRAADVPAEIRARLAEIAKSLPEENRKQFDDYVKRVTGIEL